MEHSRLPPTRIGGFEFVVLAALRSAQLMRGCTPTIDVGSHKPTVVAQMEIASGRVRRLDEPITV